MNKGKGKKYHSVALRIPVELVQIIKIEADEKDYSISDIIRDVLKKEFAPELSELKLKEKGEKNGK
jgi:hypothetical protein